MNAIQEIEKEQTGRKVYMRRSDVANLFDVHENTVDRWAKSGVIQAYRIGGRTLFKRSEIKDAVRPG